MHLRTAALTIALALVATAAVADDADEIRRLDKEISVATWTADPVWFQENLADDYALVTPNGAIRTKQDVIRELATPGLKMQPYDPTEVQVRLYGDTAVVNGRMLQRFFLGGIGYANDLRYTDVYVKRKGRWLIVTAHVSSVAVRR